jgi:two-component system CheB/CheR fusion protein
VGLAVAVLDRQQHVQIWNGQARDMWGLSPDEAEDRNFLALEFGLPVERLKSHIRDCLAGKVSSEELVLEATNRRGRNFNCKVTFLPVRESNDGAVSGVIVMMEDAGNGAAPSS